MTRGLMIAAPSSGQGKTIVTLGLIAALRSIGEAVTPFKTGPDYIDPGFLAMAAEANCLNLDPWCMSDARIRELLATADDMAVVESVMGLFDGAADGTASSADMAASLGLPVVLVVDCARQSQSLAALVHGFSTWRLDTNIAGVILNRVGSARHERLLKQSLPVPVFGCLPSLPELTVPSRHLGLVLAQEQEDIGALVETAGNWVRRHVDLDGLMMLARDITPAPEVSGPAPDLPPLGNHIAVAADGAFTFFYPHLYDAWNAKGATISFFSPLADQAPPADADAIYLPGGYPELFAGDLAAKENFKTGLKARADAGATVYGECGGYMVLGETLIDRDGLAHRMSGLLPLATSFADPKRQLGYRRVELARDLPLGKKGTVWKGHEFHMTTALTEDDLAPDVVRPFLGWDAEGEPLGVAGLMRGKVFGSYFHLIDRTG